MSERARWDELFRRFQSFEDGRREDERARAAETAALEEFHQWCAAATDRVMADLAAVASSRAEQFEAQTGHAVEVTYPSHPPISLGAPGPDLSFLRMSLADSHVHVYSYRGRGSLPVLHLVHTSERNLPRHRRLVSSAGCFIARGEDDTYQLRNVRTEAGGEATPASLDDLVFRAFELLVQSLRRR